MNKLMRMIRHIWNCPSCKQDFDLNRKMNARHMVSCVPAVAEAKAVEEITNDLQPNILTVDALGSNGRLGNQMFQVASTIGIATKHGAEAVLPPWYCTYTKKHISQFFENPVKQVALVQMRPVHNYMESGFAYQEIPFRKNMRIKGYFQSERYFEHCTDVIRHHFKPSQAVIDKIVGKYGMLLDGNTCAVHIRRGDYVNNSVHGVCDMAYYQRGMAYVSKQKAVDKFFIFSDDIRWCQENLRGDNYVYVSGNIDVEDLFIMSMCKNFVISNSSFSWWASWLCEHPQKIIVAPTKWFTDSANMDQKDIYTKQMTRL